MITVTAPAAATPVAPTQRPNFAGTDVGLVTIPKRQDPWLVAGKAIGADTGYATLRGAMNALTKITAGNSPAGAVFQDGGRFYGQSVLTRYATDVPYTPYNAGASWKNETGIRFFKQPVALVDGDNRFINNGSTPRLSGWSKFLRGMADAGT